jgi:serine-type D-Ala-D-Ala carboxypeptidase/endopeptidase
LEEPVIDFANAHVPCFGECHITLRQLATHTSGLPAWPDNRGDTESPYSGHDLCGYLNHASLVGKPDGGALYSNTGFALLGDILAKHEGTTFNSLLQRKICKPLGMTHTQVGLPKEDEPYLARGHWANGRATHPSSPTAGGGADGIRSTVNDLLKLAGAYIGVQPTDFGPAMQLSTKSYKPFNEQLDSGLGWFVDTADGTIEKSGKIAGYRTNISMSLDRKCAVVVLAGSEAFPSPKLGKELLDMMVYRRDLIESDEIFNIMQNQ